MTTKEALTKIRVMLGMEETQSEAVEVQLAEAELVDGTVIKYDGELAPGTALMVATPEGDIPAPEGTHETKDGLLLFVDSQGVIVDVQKAEDIPVDEQMSEESDTAFSNELLGAIAEMIKPLNEKIASIEGKFSSLDEDFKTFKAEPAGEKIKNNYNFEKENTKDSRLNAIANLRNKK